MSRDTKHIEACLSANGYSRFALGMLPSHRS